MKYDIIADLLQSGMETPDIYGIVAVAGYQTCSAAEQRGIKLVALQSSGVSNL